MVNRNNSAFCASQLGVPLTSIPSVSVRFFPKERLNLLFHFLLLHLQQHCKSDNYIYHLQINANYIYHIMNAVKNRLVEFVNYKGISKREFCRSIDVSATYLASDTDISIDKVVKILTVYPEININWLILGGGNMIVDLTPAFVRGMANAHIADMVNISEKLGLPRPGGAQKQSDNDARLWGMIDAQQRQLEAKDRQLEAKDEQLAAKDRLLETQMQIIEKLSQRGDAADAGGAVGAVAHG